MPKNIYKPNLRRLVYEKFNGHCAYCGCELENIFQVDHHIPKNVAKGSDEEDNLMPCCGSCNASKSDLSIEQFRERVYDRIARLNKYSTEYNIAKRFGLVMETKIDIIFYFEKFTNG